MKRSILTTVCMLTLVAGSARADQVFLDDIIVDGSQCIGLDCVNGEAFGFNTLVLKENNLRIRFQDTSSSASFPSVDWLIEANSSQNGGSNHFAVVNEDAGQTPFLIDSSAGHGAMIINGAGVGLGVDPQTDLHVMTGDTPVMRLEQSGSDGWAPATWDVGANESNLFIRYVSDTSTVPVRIMPGAATDALVVETNGDISVGGVVNTASSRSLKFGITPVESTRVLETLSGLQVSRWQYVDDERQAEHLGPMAEDFHQAFGLGADNRHIAASDLAGVAVSAVQAVHQQMRAQAGEIARLKQANAALEARLTRLEAALAQR